MSRWSYLGLAALVLLWLAELTVRMQGRADWFLSGLPIAVALLALSWRSRRPLAAVVMFTGTVLVAIAVQSLLSDPTPRRTEVLVPIVAIVLLGYSLGSRGKMRDVAAGAPLLASLVLAVNTIHGDKTASEALTGAAFAAVFFVVAPLGVGLVARSHRSLAQRVGEMERLAGGGHQANIGRVRAEAQLAVATQLQTTLQDGLRALAGEHDRRAFEEGARALLESTRDVVVTLTAAKPVTEVTVVPGLAPPARDRLDGWVLLVAAAFGIVLLGVSRDGWTSSLSAVLLAGALVGALVSIARFPVLGIAGSWVLLGGFDRLAAPVGDTFVPLGLYVATLVFAGWLPSARWVGPSVVAVVGAAYSGGVATGDVVGFVVAGLLALTGGLMLRRYSALVTRIRAAHGRATLRRSAELEEEALGQRLAAAREVHDAVGHRLTVAALQAGAARRLAGTDVAQSDEAFGHARSAIEHAHDELIHGFAHPPALRELVHGANAAGARVEVSSQALAEGLDEVLLRVVQECLTNAMRHAPGALVRIDSSSSAQGTEVSVTNGPGTTGTTEVSRGGRGLAGIAERVRAAGGSAAWFATSDGGFRVEARLPARDAVSTW